MARNDEINLEDIDDDDVNAPRQLREYAKRQAQKAERADSLEREVAFLKAGVDTSTRKGQAFAATFEGDIKDVAAIVADATEFDPSILRGATPAPATQVTATSEQTETETTVETPATGTAERTALANGAMASSGAVEDIVSASMTSAREAMERGAGQDEAIGSMIAQRARGAADGKIQVLDAQGRRSYLGV